MKTETHRSSRSILIAEDDRGIRSLLALILQGADYDVVAARDGAEALHLAQLHHPDLLLIDVHMPQLGGPAVCRAYRERGGASPVVLISASSDGPAVARACAADGFIAKPFHVATILDAVTRYAPMCTADDKGRTAELAGDAPEAA